MTQISEEDLLFEKAALTAAFNLLIKIVVERDGIKEKYIADILGYNPQSFSRLKKGDKNSISYLRLFLLAERFDLQPKRVGKTWEFESFSSLL